MNPKTLEVLKERFNLLHTEIENILQIVEPSHAVLEAIDFEILCSSKIGFVHPENKTKFTELVKLDSIITNLYELENNMDKSTAITMHLISNIKAFRLVLQNIDTDIPDLTIKPTVIETKDTDEQRVININNNLPF